MTKKIILITGVSSGIGKCCADELTRHGHTVYGISRKPQLSKFPNLHFISCDVTDRESVQTAINKIIQQEGRIDVLMNNAGAGIVGALDHITKEEFDFQMKVNLEGVINMCCQVIPIFRKQRSGMVINVSSVGGVMGLPFQGLYSASKFAIEGYSEALRLELHSFNIKVKLIEPGDFNTGFTGNRVISHATLNDPDYKDQFECTLKIIENNENSGSNPSKIAKLVLRMVNKESNKFRYPVGNIIERLSIFVKRIVPGRLYQWILRIFYKIK